MPCYLNVLHILGSLQLFIGDDDEKLSLVFGAFRAFKHRYYANLLITSAT